ncbi:MAG: hypothetical protein WBA54_07005 [Acidaminobacteraceae bacterium]
MRISICGWQTDSEDIEISLKGLKESLNEAIKENSTFVNNI